LKAKSTFVKAVCACTVPSQGLAAPLELSSAPAGTDYKLPAPNVILSVDDSASLATDRLDALKKALVPALGAIPDHAIRLGWQDMHGCLIADCPAENGVKDLDAPRRAALRSWVDSLKAGGDTPPHRMLRSAGVYLGQPASGDLGAWAGLSGQTSTVVLPCRRAYDILLTDGRWTGTGGTDAPPTEPDGTTLTLPDGVRFDPLSEVARIYKRPPGSLADLAFHGWATDLQPGLPNDLRPRIRQPGDSRYDDGRETPSIPEYWNPRNDPATWQHLSTYAVGLMKARASGETDAPRAAELRHASIASRGRFITAQNADSIAAAFRDIFDEILTGQTTAVSSLSADASTLQLDGGLFAAGYDATDWSGAVTAYNFGGGTTAEPEGLWGTTAAVPAAGSRPAKPARPRSTADIMDEHDGTWPDARLILSSNSEGSVLAPGIPWTWDRLSNTQKSALMTLDGIADTRSDAEATARLRMAYLRGDRSLEQSRMPAGPFRNRSSRHGDIVNSKLWVQAGKPSSGYTLEDYAAFRAARSARPSMLYVGANEGMLHGFDMASGEEKIAYVPEGLHSKLAQLTSPAYGHAYFVDGSPFTGDLYLGPPGSNDAGRWRTYLAGFPGAGGKGYFVLDVSDPGVFDAANAAGIVVLDRSGTDDPDIGYIASDPVTEAGDPSLSSQIRRMNDGRWALVMGNGANSTSEQAVLLIQYLDGDRKLVKLRAGEASGNGLSAPRLVDLNGDRNPDVAYAGDLQGNLWKFDLSADDPGAWKVAFSGKPFFVARDATPAGQRQPITAAPVWKAHPQGGLMIAFATGRNLTVEDPANDQPQTVYGIRDDTPVTRKPAVNAKTLSGTVALGVGSGSIAGRAQLVEQTIAIDAANRSGTVSSHPVSYAGSDARRGWFIDLPVARERVLQNLGWFDGNLIDVWSTVPASGADPQLETCDPPATAGTHYRTTIDILSGAAPKSPLYDDMPMVAAASAQVSRVQTGGSVEIRSGTRIFNRSLPGQPATPPRSRLAQVVRRASWRQLQ
jgi:type IV pilus assembly protein PilY1